MRLTILVENISSDPNLIQQFGLSALVEYEGPDASPRKILFDTGLDSTFAHNADRLRVDLSEVDVCVISHAHEDHAGGLREFFARNSHAPVYLKEEARGRYYVETPDGVFYAGVDQSLFDQYPDRFVFVKEDLLLFPGCHLITGFAERDHYGVLDSRLMMDTPGGGLRRDTFAHELAIVLELPQGLALLSGCSHNGIGNILDAVKERFPQPLAALVGGFHLAGPPAFSTLNTTREEILRLSQTLLADCRGNIYTCHCTGIPPYEILSEAMGDRLAYLNTGAVIEL